MTSCVYALVNPMDNKVFYVGKVGRRGYKIRLKEHIEGAILGKGNGLKNKIIRSILEKSLKVKIVILEYVFNDNILSKIEKRWIDVYRKLNKFLTNWGKSETVLAGVVLDIPPKPFEHKECIYPFDLINHTKELNELKSMENEQKMGIVSAYRYIYECMLEHWINDYA